MQLFTWDASLATDIKGIDDQHRKLIDWINEPNEAMLAKKGKDILGRVLMGLLEYTQYHFHYEESLLEKYGYPKLAEQRASHLQYVEKIREFEGKHERDELGVSVHVLTFLLDWIKNHIMHDDKEYVPFLKGKGL